MVRSRKKKTRVVIVDDHPLFRQGLRHAIERDAHLEISGESGDAESALELILQEKPDVIVLDLNLPGMNGFDLIGILRNKKCSAPIVILTML